MTDITLVPGKFSIDDHTPYWDGFDEPGKSWNGWRMPFFDEQVMLQVKAHLESAPGWVDGPDGIAIEHHPERDAPERFTVVETEEKHRSTPCAVNVDGTWLWALGDGWCWVRGQEDAR